MQLLYQVKVMKKDLIKLSIIFAILPFVSAGGYIGDLPNLDKTYEYKPNKNILDDVDAEDILPLDKNDLPNNYRESLLKNSKYSSYLKDLDEVITLIEQLKNCLNDKKSVQHYKSIAGILDLHVKDFKKKYGKDNQAYFESYKALTNLNENIKLFGDYWVYQNHNVKHVSNYKTAGFYSDISVSEKIEKLFFVIEDTLTTLKESDG